MKRILLANHAQFEGRATNLGDWAIFEQMIECLSEEISNGELEVIVPSLEPEFTNENYPVKAFKRGGLLGILNTLKWIIKSDIVVIGGGEIVQDKSSLVYIPYQLIRPLIAKIFKKKLFGYAIGVGEVSEISLLGRIQAKIVLNMFDIITVRDEKSEKILKEHLFVKKPKIVLTADPALNLTPTKIKERNTKQEYCIISVRSVFHRNHNLLPFAVRKKLKIVPSEYYSEIEYFKEDVASVADTIIEQYGYKVKFLNTYIGKQMSAQDDEFTKDVINKMKNKMEVENADDAKNPKEVKGIISNAKFVISVPLHPLILGASENVPVFSLAYASKNICFMKQINCAQYIYKVENLGEKVDKGKLINDIGQVLMNYDSFINKLKKSVDINKEREKNNKDLLIGLIQSDE